MNNWIEWEDGECPVDGDVVVEVESNVGCFAEGPASDFDWGYNEHLVSMIRYRVVEAKPIDTPYQPEVGEWCEHAENSLRNKHKGLYYIGKDSSGFKVFNNRKGDLLKFGRPSAFRPIKTEEELFVEAALTLDCHPSEGMLSRTDFVIEMHKAGFKAPE